MLDSLNKFLDSALQRIMAVKVWGNAKVRGNDCAPLQCHRTSTIPSQRQESSPLVAEVQAAMGRVAGLKKNVTGLLAPPTLSGTALEPATGGQ